MCLLQKYNATLFLSGLEGLEERGKLLFFSLSFFYSPDRVDMEVLIIDKGNITTPS